MSTPVDLCGLLPTELAEVLGGRGRAREAWVHLRDGRNPFAPGVLSERAGSRLREHCRHENLEVGQTHQAPCGTTKLWIALRDGHAIETVVIPSSGRTTICVSTQVGCARACAFCATATMGLWRSLSVAEIVEQTLLGIRVARDAKMPPVSNVVYMGMGEPLDNLEAVARSVQIITHPHALAIAPRHVTISTIGPSPQRIRRLRQLQASLAWSLHAVDDALRHRLIPSTRHPVHSLREAFLEVTRARGAILLIEMTLIHGQNDAEAHARALADFLEPFSQDVRVNLLPMNPTGKELVAATPEATERFRDTLRERKLFCMIRAPRGNAIQAGCGQLATAGAPSRLG